MRSPAIPSSPRSLRDDLRGVVGLLFGFVAVLWTVEIVDQAIFAGALDQFGLVPRSVTGLLGLATAPLLHGGFGHLLGNTIGLVLLGGLTLAIGRREFFAVTAAGFVLGGLGTWIFGRSAVHIGASGLVFAYLGFLLLRGWYDRRPGPIVLSLLVAWFQGGMLMGMIPGVTPPGISWEGHLFGFLAGALIAAKASRLQAKLNHHRSMV